MTFKVNINHALSVADQQIGIDGTGRRLKRGRFLPHAQIRDKMKGLLSPLVSPALSGRA